MDLLPRDYKKSDSAFSPANPASGPNSLLTGLKDRISGDGANRFSSLKMREVLLRLASIISWAALILILLLWGGLYFYQQSLNGQINDLKRQQAEVFSAKDKETAIKIVDFDRGMTLTQELLKKHIYSSAIFDSLAAVTLPRVQWLSFDFIVKDGTLNLKGLAGDYSTLAKQMLALQEGGFSNVKVSNIGLDKVGGVSFAAIFNFDPKILLK